MPNNDNQALDSKKQTPDYDQIAENTAEEARIFVEAMNPVIDQERAWKQTAKNTLEQINVQVQADNALVDALEPEPDFVPPKDQELLFDQINALVESQNLLDQGSLQADHHYQHLLKDRNAGQYNPESVIDERIKEEQKDQELSDFKDELVNALD